MSDKYRNIVVTAADAPLAQEIAACVSGGSGMFTTGLSPSGTEPATHYISSGLLPEAFVAPLPLQAWTRKDDSWTQIMAVQGDVDVVLEVCRIAGLSVTRSELNSLFANSDVTEDEPGVAFERLGLKMVEGE